MIAIGCATTDEQAFRLAGAATIEALDEGDSVLLRRHGRDSVAELQNEMLAAVAERDDLEALVLVHQDTVVDCGLPALARVRELLMMADVALVAAIGSVSTDDATTVDATLLALSPWTVRNLAFDAALGSSADACALDFALRARAAGRRVVGVSLGVLRLRPARAAPSVRRREIDAWTELGRRWDLDAGWERR